ncbi:MAG: hypothetical protein O6704_08655 [Nitrospinae bacterium]|nr:hypothetical protein [Nitrospinota bacterium]
MSFHRVFLRYFKRLGFRTLSAALLILLLAAGGFQPAWSQEADESSAKTPVDT